MSGFKFAKLQRVIVPEFIVGAPDVQGVIIGGGVPLDGIPGYNVHFLDPIKRIENGHMDGRIATVSEPDLIAAQPPKMVSEDAALALAKKSFDDGRASVLAEIGRDREARARKRKKTAKAKSKSKRKH